jgi:hypothetical protein
MMVPVVMVAMMPCRACRSSKRRYCDERQDQRDQT